MTPDLSHRRLTSRVARRQAGRSPPPRGTKTRGSHQQRGIGRDLVRVAEEHARAAGCEWLHVDHLPELAPFYLDACGFRRTDAGLVHLTGGE
ncbi:GNAT family N-acetyltransferase [Kineococcus sp. GCM10028916]|uniref:GNAT family N-acetyltransferase n=1 Tax=Kineococcus sp. GCM10028916 TaxID=3273394 RepID=UPI003639FCC0